MAPFSIRLSNDLAELLEEARQLKGDPETLRMVEEWIPIDNEAMEIAEGHPAADADEEEPWWE